MSDCIEIEDFARPTLQYVQADATQLVNVWVVDLGQEANLGRCHGIIIRKEELELEDAPYMG